MGGGTCQSGLECNDDDTCEGEPCGAIGLACCTGAGQDCFGGADCVDDVCEMAEEQDDCGGNVGSLIRPLEALQAARPGS